MPLIRPALLADASYVAQRLREADRQEIAAVTPTDPLVALQASLRAGPAWVCVDDQDQPFALFGNGFASPWMLGTEGIEGNWRWFLRNTPEIVRLMQGDHPVIVNAVDARNERHVRWIKWAGFTLLAPTPGPFGHPFIPFYRRAPCA